MIEVVGLTKSFGQVRAVDNLSFTVKPGRVTGFLGPNGAGKSTTMRMILGLDAPTSGTATIKGCAYRDLSRPATTVGALLDAHAVHPNRSAANHLRWIAHSNGLPTSRVEEVLSIVGLSDVAKKKAGGFSLGMGQRLGLAAALLGDPEILLLDEPINGLDPEGIRWVRTLLRGLAAEGRTVLVSSHVLSEMAQTADHLLIIGRGRLVADTSVADFIDQHSQGATRIRSDHLREMSDALAEERIAHHSARDEQGRVYIEVPHKTTDEIGLLAYSVGVPLSELSYHQSSLEDAYIKTTQGTVQYRGGEA